MDDPLELLPYAVASIVTILTLPSIWRFARNIHRVKDHDPGGLYEDQDGVATEESMGNFSARKQIIVISLGVAVGLAASFAFAVFATVSLSSFDDVTQLWLLFWTWILVAIQVMFIIRDIRPIPRYQLGVFSSVSLGLVAVFAVCILSTKIPDDHGRVPFIVTLALQVASSIIACITFLFIKRRPDVFAPNGKVVERQFQGSLWARYSYNWSSDILDMAATKLVQLSDLPAMDSHVRASKVKERFRTVSPDSDVSLWRQIAWAFRWNLLFQWALVIFSSIMDAAPQFATLKLLQYLESRQETVAVDPKAWLCVGFLFLTTMAGNVLDYRVAWLMWSDLGIPIRSTLTGLMFEKMMKVIDSKEPPKKDAEDPAADEAKSGSDPKNVKPEPTTKEAAKKAEEKKKKADQSQQDVINMFAVDTNQVGMFGAINQFYIMFASKFMVSVVFLWLLVGWESLGAGMVAIAVAFPVNKWVAERYGSYQKKLMAARDKKTKVISEALQGIRQIKFSGMEPQWFDKINAVREEELVILWQTRMNNLYMTFSGDIAPIFLTILALATYSYIHGDLLPSIAFTALGVFAQLEGVLGMVPFLFMLGINAKVSCDRIDNYLKSPEKPKNCLDGDHISFEDVSVTFPSKSNLKDLIAEETEDEDEETSTERKNRFVLRDITLDFPSKSLSVISGPTGSGKSLLLAAILGEVNLLSGSITVPRAPPANERFDSKATAADWLIPTAIAFVSQTPWIENASIKDNILFGLPYDEIRYNKVLAASALEKDLGMLDDGDLTEVGAQGISLSGGQKWRLTLARAFYSRAGILIFDDVFSALDSHVGRHIYEQALTGELSEGRTRILVTHHVALGLSKADYVVRLSAEGNLEYAGLVKEARETGTFENILKDDVEEGAKDDQADQEQSIENTIDANGAEVKKPAPKKLIEDEKRESGQVKRSVYTKYLGATGGIPFWSFVFIFYVIAQALTLTRSYWIKIWTSSYEHNDQIVTAHSYVQNPSVIYQAALGLPGILGAFPSFNLLPRNAGLETSRHVARSLATQAPIMLSSTNASDFSATVLPIEVEHRTITFYLVGYVIISLISAVFDVGRYYFVYRGSLRASTKVFQNMAFRILRTPLRWLDTVPTGRILNRFTADFQSLDTQLAVNFAQLNSSFLGIIGIMVAASLVSPYIIILALLLLVICGQVALRYIRGARSIKRLESIQKSPMISLFSASLEGLSTIRAFGNVEIFEARMNELIDSFTTATWHNWLFTAWVSFRMAMVGSVFSTAVAAFIVSTNGVDASLAGFALAFALSFRRSVNQTLRLVASTELDMNAAERIFEYSNLEMEDQGGIKPRASWPEEGDIVVKDLEVGYAEGLPAILKGLSFHAERNQRIGVVGRTGAGKSTLSLALFRFLQSRKGSISIDGVDISTIDIRDLRTRLAIIP
ncbi:ATP-dependent bile acid permease, partial [Lachnellula suecica]